jgi:hypothetical protein
MKQPTFKRSMLEYSLIILGKMKFNRILFRKEYRKTFQYLDATEHDELKRLLRSNRERSTLDHQ